MTQHIGLLIGAAWGFSSVIAGFLIARAIPQTSDDTFHQHGEGNGTVRGDQRHSGSIIQTTERNHGA